MSAIRVGFHAIGGRDWIGGRNLLWNLLHAVCTLPDRCIQPVLVTSGNDGHELLLPGVDRFVRGGALDSWAAHVSGNLASLLGCNPVDQYWMRRAGVDVYSHGIAPLGSRARLPWIYLIPDMQHCRHPALFSKRQRLEREWMFRTALDHAAAVIVLSAAVHRDLVAAYGKRAEGAKILRSVSSPRVPPSKLSALHELRLRFGVPNRFFHLPNQFWKHKNHAVVVEALAIAVRREPSLAIVATGAKEDPRHPRHYEQLMSRVRKLGLDHHFRHLGLIAYDDVLALMLHSVAVINPSCFEGWGCSVDEARALGKRALLSDIDAHREQAPPRARYFDPDDATELANLLLETWGSFDTEADERALAEATQLLPARVTAYGLAYQTLVVDTMRGVARKN